jgi:hypothetical protein
LVEQHELLQFEGAVQAAFQQNPPKASVVNFWL